MSKTKKILVCVVLLSFLFVSTADAVLWFLAGAIRAGTIAISAFVSTPIGQSVVRSAVNHVLIGGVAYWYLNRGDAVPPEEKYVQVTLTDTQAAVKAAKDKGKITFPASPVGGWGTSMASYGVPTACTSACGSGFPWLTCDVYRYMTPAGSTGCVLDLSFDWTGEYAKEIKFSSCVNGSTTKYGYITACTTDQKDSWVNSSQPVTDIVETIFKDPALTAEMQNALGRDMQRGGTLVGTPVSGEPITNVGADGATKEWPAGYSEVDVNAWLNNSPPSSAGPTATEVGTAVGTALNTGLTAIKTSVDGVKTSTDGVKTSVDGVKTSTDGVKTSVDGVKTSTDGVKASVDAGNAKVGENPGSASVPSYDSGYTDPVENNISDRIGSFIGSNPIIGAIGGSHLSLSGAVCSVSVGSAFEKPLTLDFCWMGSYLQMFGDVMVIFAGLTAAFIIFRRGD